MDRRKILIIVVAVALVPILLRYLWNRDNNSELLVPGLNVEFSGETFPMGDLCVMIDYGYSDDGDRLRYLVIRALPKDATQKQWEADSRFDGNSGWIPKLRHADGQMRMVKTDGRAYLFIGDELRSMRVEMNEHSDPHVIRVVDSLEGMWNALQQFRVPDQD